MARRVNEHFQMVLSRRAPKASGVTATALLVPEPGAMCVLGGQLPREMPQGAMCTGPIRRQMEVLCGNLRSLLADAGYTLEELAQVTFYMTDLKHMAIVDEVWRKQFVGQALPARTVVQVAALEHGAQVCIDGWAIKRAAAAPAVAPPEDPYGAAYEY